jgi:hypothetical protein
VSLTCHNSDSNIVRPGADKVAAFVMGHGRR